MLLNPPCERKTKKKLYQVEIGLLVKWADSPLPVSYLSRISDIGVLSQICHCTHDISFFFGLILMTCSVRSAQVKAPKSAVLAGVQVAAEAGARVYPGLILVCYYFLLSYWYVWFHCCTSDNAWICWRSYFIGFLIVDPSKNSSYCSSLQICFTGEMWSWLIYGLRKMNRVWGLKFAW